MSETGQRVVAIEARLLSAVLCICEASKSIIIRKTSNDTTTGPRHGNDN